VPVPLITAPNGKFTCPYRIPPVKHHTRKAYQREDEMAVVELWKTKVLPKTISQQLQFSKVSLMKILSFAKTNPKSPVSKRMSGNGQLLKYRSIQL
jgi:hypothetical protein